MTPSLRAYVLLNRVWFFGYVILVMLLAWTGVDIVAIVAVGVVFPVVAITLLNPHRSWWGPEVHSTIGNQQAVRRWAKQDLIVLVILLVAVPVVLGIVTALQQPQPTLWPGPR